MVNLNQMMKRKKQRDCHQKISTKIGIELSHPAFQGNRILLMEKKSF